MDLFRAAGEEFRRSVSPLAERMRPRELADIVGQEELLGERGVLRLAIEADRVPSMILWGPPGSGKTTIARVIAARTRAEFEQMSAVTAGVADLRRVVEAARERQGMHRRRTILFIDEIHRFNKAQQDAILPCVEDGTVTLIGATTENPHFEVNRALLSRCRVFRLQPLGEDHLLAVLRSALADGERGLGGLPVRVEDAALAHLARVANGDARAALNALELAVAGAPADADGVRHVGPELAAAATQQRVLGHDRQGDSHYDTLSAWIKSMRGSDPDAALYWLARLLEAGEDPRTIVRRLLIHAAEDVGLADPQALVVAAAAARALEWVGLPEARIPLAEATIYIACAPKSNSAYTAIDKALADVRGAPFGGVPPHLRDAGYKAAKDLGHGVDYKYPHDYPGAWVEQGYLPDGVAGGYYRPGTNGNEAGFRQRLAALWGRRFSP